MWADGQTDLTKLLVAFRNFPNTSKSGKVVIKRMLGKIVISVSWNSWWNDKSGVKVDFFFSSRNTGGRVENFRCEAGQTRNCAMYNTSGPGSHDYEVRIRHYRTWCLEIPRSEMFAAGTEICLAACLVRLPEHWIGLNHGRCWKASVLSDLFQIKSF